ncbi:nucleotidyltransferase domain-containing protein [Candidatus Woesearchaeota archaeon]|nr:nucleotidyltransferase domain-containing protein [Candidatus Woesearchaeota archaeon]
MNYKLISYAEDFVSFLLEKLNKESRNINQIILFGSVSRGEADNESDVDIFIDVINESIEDKIKDIKEKFYESIKVKKHWDLLGIKNEINCSIGKLKEWPSLRRSLIANGILLFGKYKEDIKTEPYILFVVFPGKNRNKNIPVWRAIYGYTQKVGKKKYIKAGLIKEYDGKKLARGVFVIPLEHTNKISSFLRKYNFKHNMLPFWQEKKPLKTL